MSTNIITNGADVSVAVSASQGDFPNVSGALQGWQQPLTFTRIVKTVVNFKVVETPTNYTFMGVWQPFTVEQLAILPHQERSRRWFTVHAELGATLIPDEVVTYQGTQYRVMGKLDYALNGYIEYHLVEDDTGSGP